MHPRKELMAFFRSPSQATEFALLHMEGDVKMELLGINSGHMTNKMTADQWLVSMQKMGMSDDAMDEAVIMHAEMIS